MTTQQEADLVLMAEGQTNEKQTLNPSHSTSPPSQQQGSNISSLPTPSSSVMPNLPTMQPHASRSGAIMPPSTVCMPPAHPQASVSSSSVEDFKCNICLNIASEAVLTLCGHLFCWPCLYTWLHYHSRYKECPVCKGAASETRLIPIYSLGTCKDVGNSSKLHSNNKIPPRPPAKRTESERQRRQRYNVERERRMDQHASQINNATMNQVLFGLNECVSVRDERNLNNTTNNSSGNTNNTSNSSQHLMGRETRASWIERLRAMREERLAWPVAFVHGLTSRELLHQRRQARELTLSPRLMNLAQDCPMIDPNIEVATSYCQSGQTQPGALQRALSLACMDGDTHHLAHNPVLPTSSLGGANASHTSQYLSTMSSILSSMEVFAKALELSSASALSKQSSTSSYQQTPAMQHHLRVFNMPNEEQALWQSSMRGLLAQMERLMVQLQSIQPINSSTTPTHNHILQNHWINNANLSMSTSTTQPYHHHHHHHYHIDGSLTDRSHTISPLMERGFLGEGDARTNTLSTNHILGLSSHMGAPCDPKANMGHCGMRSSALFSLHSHGSGVGGEVQQPNTSKSRKRWDVTRMST